MGLDIIVYRGVTVHECNEKKSTHTVKLWKDKKNCFYFPEQSIEDFGLFEEHEFNIYECPHSLEGPAMTLYSGYTCSVANGFIPGEIVEFENVDRFYYGSYFKWHREVHLNGKISFLKLFISDCDGYYSGPGLQQLRKCLAEVDSDVEGLREYYEMLEDIPEDELLTRTIVRHA